MKFVVLRAFDYPTEANIMKGLLVDNDIPCFLKDENIVTTNPLFSNAVGGVRLMGREEDAERAIALLSKTFAEYRKQISCPNCSSQEVHFVTEKENPKNWFSVIFSLITLSYPLYLKKKYECSNCKFVFSIK